MPFPKKYANNRVGDEYPGAPILYTEIEDDGLMDYIKSVQAGLQNTNVNLLGIVGPIMRRSFAEQFAVGGDPEPWALNRRSTILRKQRRDSPRTKGGNYPRRLLQLDEAAGRYFESGVLIDQGPLRDSYARKGARGHVERMNADGSIEIGSSIPYAAIQQQDHRDRGGGIVPARRLVVRDSDVELIKQAIDAHVGSLVASGIDNPISSMDS